MQLYQLEVQEQPSKNKGERKQTKQLQQQNPNEFLVLKNSQVVHYKALEMKQMTL